MARPRPLRLAILDELQADARLTNAELAQRVGLSAAPCWRRVQWLEQQGYINGYHAEIDRRKIGLGVLAFVRVDAERNTGEPRASWRTRSASLPEVVACHYISGAGTFELQVVATDLDAFSRFAHQDADQPAQREGPPHQLLAGRGQGERGAAAVPPAAAAARAMTQTDGTLPPRGAASAALPLPPRVARTRRGGGVGHQLRRHQDRAGDAAAARAGGLALHAGLAARGAADRAAGRAGARARRLRRAHRRRPVRAALHRDAGRHLARPRIAGRSRCRCSSPSGWPCGSSGERPARRCNGWRSCSPRPASA